MKINFNLNRSEGVLKRWTIINILQIHGDENERFSVSLKYSFNHKMSVIIFSGEWRQSRTTRRRRRRGMGRRRTWVMNHFDWWSFSGVFGNLFVLSWFTQSRRSRLAQRRRIFKFWLYFYPKNKKGHSYKVPINNKNHLRNALAKNKQIVNFKPTKA